MNNIVLLLVENTRVQKILQYDTTITVLNQILLLENTFESCNYFIILKDCRRCFGMKKN
jgi:hypothetical protein